MAAPAPLPQHLTALQRANLIRLRRAELRRGVRSIVDVVQLLSPQHVPGVRRLEPVDPILASLAAGELVKWAPRWGDVRVTGLFGRLGIPEHKPCGDLTDRQRWAIVAALTGQSSPFDAQTVTRPLTPREIRAHLKAAEARAREAEARAREAERRELESFPPLLRVVCPTCAAGVGETCSTYEPTTDQWREPEDGHAQRRRAAGLS